MITALFDGWMPIVRTLVLGVSSYIVLVILLRISGKRTLSQMNAFDFVITVAFGSTLASMLTSANVSLVQGIVALALLIFMQLCVTATAVRVEWFESILKADPTVVYLHGKFLEKAMREQRVTVDEIRAAARQSGYGRMEDIAAVVLETEGSLSVIPASRQIDEEAMGIGHASNA